VSGLITHALFHPDKNASGGPETRWLHSEFRFPIFLGFILLSVLFGLDVVTTSLVLFMGGYEQNTVMAVVVHYPAIHLAIKGIALIAIAFITQYGDQVTHGKGLVILGPVLLFYAFVIVNNATVVAQLAAI